MEKPVEGGCFVTADGVDIREPPVGEHEPAAQAVLFDQTKGQVLRTLAGHGKKVTTAWFHSEFGGGKALVLRGSADKNVKLWSTGADFSGDACSTVTARQATV